MSRDEGRLLGERRHPLSQAGVCNVPCSSFCQSPQPGLRLSLCPASAALPYLLGFRIQAHHHPFCLSSPPQLPSRFWREEITHLVPLFPFAPREKPRLPAAQAVLTSLASPAPCAHIQLGGAAHTRFGPMTDGLRGIPSGSAETRRGGRGAWLSHKGRRVGLEWGELPARLRCP